MGRCRAFWDTLVPARHSFEDIFFALHPILSLSIEKDAWALGFWIILLDFAPPSKLRHSENDLHHIEYDYAAHECLR